MPERPGAAPPGSRNPPRLVPRPGEVVAGGGGHCGEQSTEPAETGPGETGPGETGIETTTETEPPPPDGDGDGWNEIVDGDDDDPAVFPGAEEACNGLDDDCDDIVDDGPDAPITAYDGDGDGYGTDESTLRCWEGPEGDVDNNLDCDDLDASLPLWVAPGGSGSGTRTDPLGLVQEAIDSARCVVLEAGTYTEDLVVPSAGATVRGAEGYASTVLAGSGGEAPVVEAYGSDLVTLWGVTITGGRGAPQGGHYWGGDFDCFQVGAGLSANGPPLILRDVDFIDNGRTLDEIESIVEANDSLGRSCDNVFSYGGGAYVGGGPSLEAEGVRFEANLGTAGAGLFTSSVDRVELDDAEFVNNIADAGGGGGGWFNSSAGAAEDLRFEGNSASLGGGLYDKGGIDVSGAEFIGNTADEGGGAVFYPYYGEPVVDDVALVGNVAVTGSAIAIDTGTWSDLANSSVTLTRITFLGNGDADTTSTFRVRPRGSFGGIPGRHRRARERLRVRSRHRGNARSPDDRWQWRGHHDREQQHGHPRQLHRRLQ